MPLQKLRYCTRCVMPETRPDLSFDEKGVCDACRSQELKDQLDWDARTQELHQLLEDYRDPTGSNYDCLVPVSGGKDSHFQVYYLKHVCGMNPLCVTWVPCNQTELGRRNVDNLKGMGVDYIEFTGNPHVTRKLVKLGFELIGDCCWPEHVGLFTVPVQVAVRYRIPLIVWGECSQFEYGGPASTRQAIVLDRRWMEEFGGLRGLRVEDVLNLTDVSPRDLVAYTYPPIEDLEASGCRGVFLGQYMYWDARSQLDIIKRYGFHVNEEGPQEGTYTNYENLDCKYVGYHDYLMYCKYGFGRATTHACIDIRNKRLTREQALELVHQYDGKLPRKYLGEFLEEMELTEAQFFRVCDVFTNKAIFHIDQNRTPTRDQDGNLIKIWYDNDEPRAEVEKRRSLALECQASSPYSPKDDRAGDVCIVDYGMGNLRSVAKAFETIGHKATVTDRREDLETARRIVLPGVGAFGDGMRQLVERGLAEILEERVVHGGVPLLGICLGMQLLAELGLEGGNWQGLGWLPGKVDRLTPGDPALRVPHIGWNEVAAVGDSILLSDAPDNPAYYFVHGYHFLAADLAPVKGTFDYGGETVAVIERDNIFATQFHPEKSQRAGLRVLERFMTV